MESRIKLLLEKYWEGTTSLAEEKEVKEYFKQNPSLSEDGSYFRQLERSAAVSAKANFRHPAANRRWWLSAAASLLIGSGVALAVFLQYEKQDEFAVEDPQEAYEVTKKALMMLSETLNEGQNYTYEIKTLNVAERKVQ